MLGITIPARAAWDFYVILCAQEKMQASNEQILDRC